MAVTSVDLPIHGGDLAGAEVRWGRPAEGWLDLSTGINPWPYPVPQIPAAAWARLPGAAEEQALLDAARNCWSVPLSTSIVAAPGSQPLIQAVPRLLPPGEVAILGLTYGEHERAWTAAGHAAEVVSDFAELAQAQAAVVVNPNNPDGRVVESEQLASLADAMAAKSGLLLVDEAFGETCPWLSLTGQSMPNLVVLRSFGKFYGMAGLRLGFALAEREIAQRLAAMMGPWAVSGPALAIGAKALADGDWAKATRRRLTEASSGLAVVLTRSGLELVGGTSLFQLARHPQAADLYQRLGRAGILVRAFASRPDLLRFGLPDGAEGLARLARALTQ